MQTISIADVEFLTFRLAREELGRHEPIPDFQTRFPNILESCLAGPRYTFDKRNLYPTLVSRAAILFYLMIKNHPFVNGNKRIAMMTLFLFLYKNGKWLRVDDIALYNFAVWVAESPAESKDGTVLAIQDFFKRYIVSRDSSRDLS